ncbi:MAG TPA: M50 family metallopeptidase, partial [Terriglobia bacterium]|nr:M50 family metallopeptidase [Terriglobia bacterium]
MSTASTVAISSETPILDRLIPPPPAPPPRVRRKVSRRSILIITGLAGFAVFLNWLLQQPWFTLDPNPGINWGPLILQLCRVLLAFSAAVAIHELGHTIAGKLAGLRFVMMRLGPIHLTLPLRVRWQRENPLPGAAGFVVMVPKDTRRLRARYIFMLMGGPIANLLSYVVVLRGPNNLFLGWFAVMSIWMGIGNLMPARSGALVLDGRRILTLLFHSRQGNR